MGSRRFITNRGARSAPHPVARDAATDGAGGHGDIAAGAAADKAAQARADGRAAGSRCTAPQGRLLVRRRAARGKGRNGAQAENGCSDQGFYSCLFDAI